MASNDMISQLSLPEGIDPEFHESEMRPSTLDNSKTYSFIPQGIDLFETLFSMEEALNGNSDVEWFSPHYFSLPVRVYYAVIFHVQVLRAQESVGCLSDRNKSFLERFRAHYKDTSCPIAGPLIPVFKALTTYKVRDETNALFVPTTPRFGTYNVIHTTNGTQKKQTISVSHTHRILPSVPLLGSLLHRFATSDEFETLFDKYDNFNPVSNETNELGYATFPRTQNGYWSDEYAQVLTNPAIMRCLPESIRQLGERKAYWSRSSARFIPDTSSRHSFDPKRLDECLLLADDISWFRDCIDAAIAQARFLANPSNLGEIPVMTESPTAAAVELPTQPKLCKPTRADTTHIVNWSPASHALIEPLKPGKIDYSVEASFVY